MNEGIMNFSNRKLPKEATDSMRTCPIESVAPYALMLSPIYVYMKLNEKFVSVKAPLDFFEPEELKRLKPFGEFFIPAFADAALPYQKMARSLKQLLSYVPPESSAKDESAEKYPPAAMAPSSYELSDTFLRMTAPLWGSDARIEPFFVAVFVNELCGVLPAAELKRARDQNVTVFERAVFASSWVVFLALLLGYLNLEYLGALRLQAFICVADGSTGVNPTGESHELVSLALISLDHSQSKALTAEYFEVRSDRLSQKIASRLHRLKFRLIPPNSVAASIYGAKGFVDG